MGSLTLTGLKNVGKVSKGYTYLDLHLDIEESTIPTLITSERIQGKDIRVDYDEDAVVNSLVNIFSTIPGERFLVPKFGCNLRRYLFQPVSKSVGSDIGNEILIAVEAWEPRVTVDRIDVLARPEQHEYNISIQLTINEIKKQVTVNTTINQSAEIKEINLTRVCPT